MVMGGVGACTECGEERLLYRANISAMETNPTSTMDTTVAASSTVAGWCAVCWSDYMSSSWPCTSSVEIDIGSLSKRLRLV